MNIIIERLDGTQYSLADYDISVRDFIVDSPSPRFYWETIENRDGVIDLGTDYDGRTLSGSFFMSANDFLDFPLLRNEIFKIFASKEPFYLIDDREPGKRWYIKANTFSPKQVITLGEFDIEFFSPSAYAESIGTTLDPFTFDAELWQIGQGLNEDFTEVREEPTTWFDIGYKKWSEI
jgi:hypothetical protein